MCAGARRRTEWPASGRPNAIRSDFDWPLRSQPISPTGDSSWMILRDQQCTETRGSNRNVWVQLLSLHCSDVIPLPLVVRLPDWIFSWFQFGRLVRLAGHAFPWLSRRRSPGAEREPAAQLRRTRSAHATRTRRRAVEEEERNEQMNDERGSAGRERWSRGNPQQQRLTGARRLIRVAVNRCALCCSPLLFLLLLLT